VAPARRHLDPGDRHEAVAADRELPVIVVVGERDAVEPAKPRHPGEHPGADRVEPPAELGVPVEEPRVGVEVNGEHAPRRDVGYFGLGVAPRAVFRYGIER
jgi:hypothetical protein